MITFVVDGPLDQPTGGYVYDRLVIDGLRARGATVELLHLSPGGVARGALDNARVALHLARARGVTVIDELCHPRVLLGAALHRRASRAPLVALVHHLAASERSGARARARLAIERVLLGAADLAVVTSETTRGVLVGAGVAPARIRVVRPGRDRLGERAASPAPAPDGRARFLFLGSLTPRKGVLDLVAAFAALAGRAELTLAGPDDRDPGCAAAVRAAAAPLGGRIRITGTLSDAELTAALASHDALVLPSRYEGFGIALAEALSFGLAVIATWTGAIPEVVRDGAEALLVSPGSVPELAAALARVTGDRALLESMQARALERARELPRWAETQEAFAAALSESCARDVR